MTVIVIIGVLCIACFSGILTALVAINGKLDRLLDEESEEGMTIKN